LPRSSLPAGLPGCNAGATRLPAAEASRDDAIRIGVAAEAPEAFTGRVEILPVDGSHRSTTFRKVGGRDTELERPARGISVAVPGRPMSDSTPRRIGPQEARALVEDEGALLVCAYRDSGKCERIALEGSIPYSTFEEMLPDLARDRALVFY
jgi:hypothetical protein